MVVRFRVTEALYSWCDDWDTPSQVSCKMEAKSKVGDGEGQGDMGEIPWELNILSLKITL